MQDLYEKMIKDLLRKYVYASDFISRAKLQIEELETKKESRQVAKYGLSSPGGSSEGPDDKIININAKISMLKKNIKSNQAIVADVNFGLEGLSDAEKDITISIYGYRQRWGKIDELIEKYNYSKSNLYDIANACLEHMARRLYGDS